MPPSPPRTRGPSPSRGVRFWWAGLSHAPQSPANSRAKPVSFLYPVGPDLLLKSPPRQAELSRGPGPVPSALEEGLADRPGLDPLDRLPERTGLFPGTGEDGQV